VHSEDSPLKTPLYDDHVALSARMVDFAGWRMPVQYAGVIQEHLAVRERVGLFDVSHMGEARVHGPQALDFLQHVTCNNVAKLQQGRAHYTALTTPEGTFVDDLLIYDLGQGEYLLVLNAGNTPKDLAWLATHSAEFDVTVDDQSSAWAQMALQGPMATRTISGLTTHALDELKYYHFARTEVAGHSCILSRTGYTGEDGFEVYCPSESAREIWRALMQAGGPQGIEAVGLGARDTLRLEACMALYGNDIDDTTTVLEANLGWIVKFKKGEFLGRDVLLQQKKNGVERRLIGFEMQGRAIARQGYEALHDGQVVGRVTSGCPAPYIKKNVGLAYLPIGLAEPGTEFQVQVRKRTESAVVVPTPFYKRSA
jgi:aminomethyltransferase